MENKLTLVLGASLNEHRYSNLAVRLLIQKGFPVVAVGRDTGEIEGVEIQHNNPKINDVDTVTLYLGAQRQHDFYEYILGLNPKRIIFNPGAENPVLARKAQEQGINVENACTLVMLRVGNYF